MLYDVEQVAEILNVSKATIYNKIKLEEFRNKVTVKGGKRFIDEELLNLLRKNFKNFIEVENAIENKDIEQGENVEFATDTRYSNLERDFIDTLKEQLKIKDEQIQQKDLQLQELSNRLAFEQELHRNTQVMLNNKQEPQLLQLEEHFREFDLKLLDLREQMEQRKAEAEQQKKVGLLQRLFKR